MKNRKILIIALACALATTGCGGSGDANSTTPATRAEGESKKQESTGDTITTPSETTIPFKEMVVVDNEECSIKIVGIEPDNMWGYAIKIKLENKSSDKEYMFSVESAAINGVQADPLFATTVSSGKKANDNISFSDSSLKGANIGQFTDIEITFRVYDNNDWLADEVAKETIHIYPLGEENASIYVREVQSTDNVIVDNEYIKATIIGYEEDSIWGYTINLFLENKTDKEIMFSTDEVSVNGYMADPFFAMSVIPNKCAFSSISWSDSTFAENDISNVEEIEFLFKAYDNNDWTAEHFADETITLHP